MRVSDTITRAAHRLRRSRSLEIVERIRACPTLSVEAVRRRQLDKLRALVHHCQTNVPYYRELFRTIGFSATDLGSLDDIARIPVLTKDIVREREWDLVRDDIDRSTLSTHHSGGSTGVPLRFHRDRDYMDVSEAGTYRNFMQCGWRAGEMIAFFWGWNERLNGMSKIEFELRQYARGMYQFDPFRSGPADMDEWIRTWRRVRPRIVHGYASTIARFAQHMEQRGMTVPPLRGVFTTAETLFRPQREIIERVFGCHAFDCYGSSEVQNIAAECPRGGMHVNADYVVVEVDGDEHEGAGALLVTSLQNRAMPFLRYRNEDRGALRSGSCTCGSGFPLMDLRIGRVSDSFLLPDGRVVHGEFFTHLLYGAAGVDSFQFYQPDMHRIILSVVPGRDADADRKTAVENALRQLGQLAPGQLEVEYREVDQIPRSSAGKHRFTRSDVSAPVHPVER